MSQLKSLRNFTIRETNNKINRQFKIELLRYKHLENMLNILIAYEFNTTKNNNMMKLLQNSIYMKAVLSGNSGGEKTKHNIKIINDYFNHSHYHYKLFQQAIEFSIKYLNDKNISMLITRLRKDWANFFTFLKEFKKGKLSHPPSYPKPKKLKQVFNYSIPLEPGKWSSSTPYKKGHLGLNLGKSMIYTKYFNQVNKDKNNHITCPDYLQGKHINSISISLSHGQIYYQIQYNTEQSKPKRYHQINDIKPLTMPIKSAGVDIGLLNLLSVYTNDDSTKSLIISGKELISKNNSFNKGLAKLQTTLANLKSAGKIRSKEYVKAKRQRSALFEKRRRYLDNYTNQISAGLVKYVVANKITRIALSKNLSFSKSKGSIKLNKVRQQQFYQIPFGKILTQLEQKLSLVGVEVKNIDEAYSSKTSSISACVRSVQLKRSKKLKLTPNDLNGSRGVKGSKLGRGLFKDSEFNKVLNSDLNGAANHIKIGFNESIKPIWFKFCNPKKYKSNHEFAQANSGYNQLKAESRY